MIGVYSRPLKLRSPGKAIKFLGALRPLLNFVSYSGDQINERPQLSRMLYFSKRSSCTSSPPGLPQKAYTGRLCPERYLSQASGIRKGRESNHIKSLVYCPFCSRKTELYRIVGYLTSCDIYILICYID